MDLRRLSEELDEPIPGVAPVTTLRVLQMLAVENATTRPCERCGFLIRTQHPRASLFSLCTVDVQATILEKKAAFLLGGGGGS